jgi:hypothetical protein
MIIGMAQKQPAEYLDYNVDFTEWMPEDDEIASATVAVVPEGELTTDTISIMTPIVKFWAAGGVTGKTYKLTVKITTANGRIKEDELKIRVREY